MVEQLGIVGQRLEAVREALRHENHLAVSGGKLHAEPLQEGGGAAAQVDDDVPYGPGDAADQLGFLMRRHLEMHAPDGAVQAGERMVELNPLD